MTEEMYNQGDLHILNLTLRKYPDIHNAIDTIKQISQKCKFPIASFLDLADALGGLETQISFCGKRMRLAEIERLIPAYYFPISNENDLIAKVDELRHPQPPIAQAILRAGQVSPFYASWILFKVYDRNTDEPIDDAFFTDSHNNPLPTYYYVNIGYWYAVRVDNITVPVVFVSAGGYYGFEIDIQTGQPTDPFPLAAGRYGYDTPMEPTPAGVAFDKELAIADGVETRNKKLVRPKAGSSH